MVAGQGAAAPLRREGEFDLKAMSWGMVGALALGLSACGQAGGEAAKTAGADEGKFGGLEAAIHTWKADLVASHPACAVKTPEGDPGCVSFEVACKAEAVISPEEQAKGVSARVTSGMRWQRWDAKRAEYLPDSQFAVFSKTAATWTRQDAKGGDPAACKAF